VPNRGSRRTRLVPSFVSPVVVLAEQCCAPGITGKGLASLDFCAFQRASSFTVCAFALVILVAGTGICTERKGFMSAADEEPANVTGEGAKGSPCNPSPDAATVLFLATRRTRSWNERTNAAHHSAEIAGGTAPPRRKATSGVEAPVAVGLVLRHPEESAASDETPSAPRRARRFAKRPSAEANNNSVGIAGVETGAADAGTASAAAFESPLRVSAAHLGATSSSSTHAEGSARPWKRPSFEDDPPVEQATTSPLRPQMHSAARPALLAHKSSDEETGRVGILGSRFAGFKVNSASEDVDPMEWSSVDMGSFDSHSSKPKEPQAIQMAPSSAAVTTDTTVAAIAATAANLMPPPPPLLHRAPRSSSLSFSSLSSSSSSSAAAAAAEAVVLTSAEVFLGLQLSAPWFRFQDLVAMTQACRHLRAELPAAVTELSMSGRFEAWHQGRMVPRFRDCGILDATVAAAVAQFHRADYLDLSRCRRVTNRVTPHIAACLAPTLRTLRLFRTQVSDLTPLASCQQLEELGLEFTPVVDLSPLAACPKLSTLNLAASAVVDLSPLAYCAQLTTLVLTSTKVSDVSPLQHCRSLKRIALNNTPLVDVSGLRGCTSLTSLDCAGTKLHDLSPLENCDLRSLVLTGCIHVTDLSACLGMHHLAFLHAASTHIASVHGLSHCERLVTVDLSHSSCADLGGLSSAEGLRSLDLLGSAVANLTPLAGCTSLTALNLAETAVADLAPLANLKSLTKLNLGHTRVTNVGALTACSKLKELSLYSTKLADVNPLGGLSELQDLHLFGTPVRDVGALACCSSLRSLNLSGTFVKVVGGLGACGELRKLDLNGARHVADLSGLGRLAALTSLRLDSTRVSDVRELASCEALQV